MNAKRFQVIAHGKGMSKVSRSLLTENECQKFPGHFSLKRNVKSFQVIAHEKGMLKVSRLLLTEKEC